MRNLKGGILSTILLVLSGLAILFLAVFITYEVQQHTINQLNVKIANLENQSKQANQSVVVPLSNSYTSTKGVKIYIYFPRANTKTSSPLPVVGTVPGSWSFEASFPIRLEENNGKIIAQTNAHVLGNWMSTNLVIFSAQLTFPNQPSGDGKLIIEKDNPSGLTQNSDYVSIPIRF